MVKSTHRGVKTTIEIPENLWRAAKHRALDRNTDLRAVIVSGLEKVLGMKAEIPEQTAEKVKESLRLANLRGIYFDQDFVRVYPNGQMLSQVIGFVDHDHKGTMGIERTMQDFLQGTDGFRYIETDRTGKELVPYRGQESAAKDGCDVKLTIDLLELCRSTQRSFLPSGPSRVLNRLRKTPEKVASPVG